MGRIGIVFEVKVCNSFSPPIYCKEAASKSRRIMFMIMFMFVELSVSAFAAL